MNQSRKECPKCHMSYFTVLSDGTKVTKCPFCPPKAGTARILDADRRSFMNRIW